MDRHLTYVKRAGRGFAAEPSSGRYLQLRAPGGGRWLVLDTDCGAAKHHPLSFDVGGNLQDVLPVLDGGRVPLGLVGGGPHSGLGLAVEKVDGNGAIVEGLDPGTQTHRAGQLVTALD